MIPDTFDERLNLSAPAFAPVAKVDIDAMIADAKIADARPAAPRRLRPRILLTAALAAVLASGGVGMAVATDGFSWAPWAQDPIGAVKFTMANGFQCELRYTEYTAGGDPAYVNEVNGILKDWYRSADVLAAIKSFVPAALAEQGPITLEPGETLATLPPGEAEHRGFVRQWLAWDLAISDAESQELTHRGLKPGDARMAGSERSSQIKCLDENNKPYMPGAGG